MNKLLLFGGTTEGRELTNFLAGEAVQVDISVATEYGEGLIAERENLRVLSGRLSKEGMLDILHKEGYGLVADATHPYAIEVSRQLKEAAKEVGIPYLRIRRQTEQGSEGVWISDYTAAADFLAQTEGNVLLTTGSKTLELFAGVPGFSDRMFARVLPSPEVLEKCKEVGLSGKHIIAMQGPFSEELNLALCKEYRIRYLVTKESGERGGFWEKVRAAKAAGAIPVIIGRQADEEGVTLQEACQVLCDVFDIKPRRTLALVGMGMGRATLTQEAFVELREADIIAGAKRMLAEIADLGKPTLSAYQPECIRAYLKENPQYRRVAVLFSGDIGFFSGAKGFYPPQAGEEIRAVCGISSPAYLMAQLGLSWEDVHFASMHGKAANVAGELLVHGRCLSLLGKAEDVSELCRTLCAYELGQVRISIGERLGSKEERILTGVAQDFLESRFHPLSIVYLENPNPWIGCASGWEDTAFVRSKVPMTKREVRAVVLSYLAVQDGEVVYDIGAGTGSVAIEIARQNPRGKVFAIEKKPEAIALLQENRLRHNAGNVAIIEAEAPDLPKDLPCPDRAFLGGTGGRLAEIIEYLLHRNPNITIVLTAVTLTTLSKAVPLFLQFEERECIQLSVSRAEERAGHWMLRAESPVFLCKGKGRRP